MSHRTFFALADAGSLRERRLLFVEAQSAEEAHERATTPVHAPKVTAENSAEELYGDMRKELKRMGFWRSLPVLGKVIERETVSQLIDEAAQREIETKTNAAVSWIGGFVKRRKYREYVALQHAVKERLRSEVEAYVQHRRGRLEKLSSASSVSSRLRRLKAAIPIKTEDGQLQSALGRVHERLQRKRERAERHGYTVPQEWERAAELEAVLKRELIRFQVVPSGMLDSYLEQNAQGNKVLIEAIKAHPFKDPDDPHGEPYEAEKELCLSHAKQLRDSLLNTAYRGYRNFRLTQRTGNELPFAERLRSLTDRGDVVGAQVQFLHPVVGLIDAEVIGRDTVHGQILILQRGNNRYVLDTDNGRLTYRDGSGKFHHPLLSDKTFSILHL